MSEFIFIFFAGIALTTGLSYIGFSVLKNGKREELLFGLFSTCAAIYYILLSIDSIPVDVTMLFATGMFTLFPWYLAYEARFIKKPVLWLITLLGVGYYLAILSTDFLSMPDIPYFFSYSVYLLTSIYCLGCIITIMKNKNMPIWPFFVITAYYILFTAEEIAFDIFAFPFPWRELMDINYLDLFPIIIIAFKLTLLIYDHLIKIKLQKEVNFYKSNINTILNQTKKYVLSIDVNGRILFVNPFFQEFFKADMPLLDSNIKQFITEDTKDDFHRNVLTSFESNGDIVSKFKSANGIRTIAWSFVKLKDNPSSLNDQYVTLFGTDISSQKETEEHLNEAYHELEILKNKLLAENVQLRMEGKSASPQGIMVGNSPNFNYVLHRIEDVAPLDVPVLLEGETGVGKELVATAVHTQSLRKNKPFIKINCSAIPENLLESELFGYEPGAFTGADNLKRGMFELADGGTLFLDEIGDLPMSLQPKLLRALQEGEIKRLGSESVIKVDIRLLAATNLNLHKQVEKGEFRSDLFYRLNVFPITIPPLRKRSEDIPLLINAFINSFNKKYNKNITEISEGLLQELTSYTWPGNIRQLRNVIERAVITSSSSVLKLVDPLPNINKTTIGSVDSSLNDLGSLEEFERKHILKILHHCGGKISGSKGAAEMLKLPASTLRSKMKKLGIKAQPKARTNKK